MEIKKKLYYICSAVLLIVFIVVFLLYFRLGEVDLHAGHMILSTKKNIKKRTSCNNPNVLHECKTDQDCSELCSFENKFDLSKSLSAQAITSKSILLLFNPIIYCPEIAPHPIIPIFIVIL